MAKKTAAVKKPECCSPAEPKKNLNLVEAIVTVRNLQDFINERGGLEAALGTVARVSDLVAMTGGFEGLKSALEIVGGAPAPAAS